MCFSHGICGFSCNLHLQTAGICGFQTAGLSSRLGHKKSYGGSIVPNKGEEQHATPMGWADPKYHGKMMVNTGMKP